MKWSFSLLCFNGEGAFSCRSLITISEVKCQKKIIFCEFIKAKSCGLKEIWLWLSGIPP